jgi:hypothetical protein
MTEAPNSSKMIPRVSVVQIGARRNYAIPIALQQAGMLECLFTDWYAPKSSVTKVIGATSTFLPWATLKRANARLAPEIPVSKAVHFPWFAAKYKWMKRYMATKGQTPLAYVWGGKTFCNHVIRHGLGNCTVVYCFSSVAKEVFAEVEGKHIVRVLDQEVPVLAFDERMVQEQEEAYPEWCAYRSMLVGVEEYTDRQREEWSLADIVVCPSSFCRRGLAEHGAPLRKIHMLPFGIHQKFFCKPVGDHSKGEFRVLFVANSPIRKGLPDLVLALERLKTRKIKCTVVGNHCGVSAEGISRASNVAELLGCVSGSTMVNLYRQSHVLVHPTVSDTFGAVVLEAMAAGLPVITTPHCGAADIIRDGIDGFIVPVRSPDAIAEKIDLLASDRELLYWMSENARQRAQVYSLDKYRERLVKVLYNAVGMKHSNVDSDVSPTLGP